MRPGQAIQVESVGAAGEVIGRRGAIHLDSSFIVPVIVDCVGQRRIHPGAAGAGGFDEPVERRVGVEQGAVLRAVWVRQRRHDEVDQPLRKPLPHLETCGAIGRLVGMHARGQPQALAAVLSEAVEQGPYLAEKAIECRGVIGCIGRPSDFGRKRDRRDVVVEADAVQPVALAGFLDGFQTPLPDFRVGVIRVGAEIVASGIFRFPVQPCQHLDAVFVSAIDGDFQRVVAGGD